MPHKGRIGIIVNPNRNETAGLVRRIASYLAEHGQQPPLVEDTIQEKMEGAPVEFVPRESLGDHTSMVITLGGDGTLLRASRLLAPKGIPVWALNTGTLGFLTEGRPTHLNEMMDHLLRGEYTIENRMMIEAQHIRGYSVMSANHALNDVVFSFHGTIRMRTISVWVEDELVSEYEADGIIVSTPTGSTAYSLSAGGPIVEPSLGAFIINPICPHTLTNRPVVISCDKKITINASSGEGTPCVAFDGQAECSLEHPEDVIVLAKASFETKLIRTAPVSYYEMLRRKLNWGGQKKPGEE